ncbi:MAG: EscS/YscS/HrcS family type III secretion system export apparatus protein [Planctomycetes bacterium]|jgi:flagellar biosynthetic protein FliQ|nr:EscS/YscS/HrcS family type III secretion system export apparatus protein [Planctomycetota bacterium]
MTEEMAMYIGRRALEMTMLLMAPVLIVTLVVGFAAALLQAVTSIRDMTMGLVLKLVSIALTMIFTGGWMIQTSVDFTRDIFNMIEQMTK